MRKLLGVLAFAAAASVGLGAFPAHALSPDDAIYLTKEGVEDPIIIAKICADAVAWDLTAEEIALLRDKGVSREVVEALIDPEAAATRYGFTLGDPETKPETYPDNYAEGTSQTSLIFSFGYYYGPLGVHYLYDPYFYPFYCSPGWGFSYSYWPSYYRSTYFPYHYGYYSYPYYCYSSGYYSGYPYYGPAYPYYCSAPLPSAYYAEVKAPVRYRDYAYTNPPPAYGSDKPNSPEQRLANSGRTVLDQYARDARGRTGEVDVIRGGKRSTETVRGVDGRSQQIVRGGEGRSQDVIAGGETGNGRGGKSVDSRSGRSVGRGSASERYLASRDITSMGRSSQRGTARGDKTARIITPGSGRSTASIGRGRSSSGSPIGTPRTMASTRSGYAARGGQRSMLRTDGRSSGTPGTGRGNTPQVIRGSGRSAPSTPGTAGMRAPSGRAPVMSAPRGGGASAPKGGAPAARGGGRGGGGGGGGGRGR